MIRTNLFLFFEMKCPAAQAGFRLTYVAEDGLTSFSGVVAVAQSAAHLSVLAVVELEQEQVQGFFTASVSSPTFSFLTPAFL